MNKVVCNVCGTSYPENATQCPICGFVRNTELAGSGASEGHESNYTYVKGGRYSKANVRKRNMANQIRDGESADPILVASKPKKEKSRTGMIVIVTILLLAIIAVVGYIALRFFIPNDFLYEGLDNFTVPVATEEAEQPIETEPSDDPVEETPDIDNANAACSAILLENSQITLNEIGQSYELLFTLEPEDTTDPVTYTSSDSAIATVDANGIIIAKAEGTAVITVTCGDARAECTVVCVIEPITEATEDAIPESGDSTASFTLNRREITFDMEGQSWVLYDGGKVSVFDIAWSSDDDSVATIANGKVVAVANGDTTVYGSYDGQTVSCVIHCKFDGEGAGTGGSGISEAGSDVSRTYKLHNPYGLADDVTIRVGEQFPLMLVDENENEITDAQWSVGNTDCCSYESKTVKGLAVGTTEITATYEGVTYTCVARVIE